MLKKLLIPCLLFAAAVAVGCSDSNKTSSNNNTAGSGGSHAGSGGSAAGSGGSTAGSGGSAAGSGGSTAGSGGSAAGSGGSTAGSGGSTAGSGGSTAGSGGSTAGSGGTSDGGAGAGAAGSDGGTAGSDGGSTINLTSLEGMCAAKRSAAESATPYTAAEFCAVYMDVCGSKTFTGMLTAATCQATYDGWATKKVTPAPMEGVQNCVSYHLCNAYGIPDPTDHCPHAAGMGPCAHAN
jgi:hypothetical protein